MPIRQLELPEKFRTSMVRLRFLESIPLWCKSEFLRIRLTRKQLDNGEGDFWMPEALQAHRIARRRCKRCGHPQQQIASTQATCVLPACPLFRKIDTTGPVRGVIKVATKITGPQGDVLNLQNPDNTINGCLLCLDRRYETSTLQAVHNTAVELANGCGWKVAS